MITEGKYDIHSLVQLLVRGDPDMVREIDLHLGTFKCEQLKSQPTVIIEPYDLAPPTRRTTVVDDYEFGDDGYNRRAIRFRCDLLASPQAYHMDRLHLPINLIVQLALLRTGHTFLHGAGLSIDGHRVLFPAFPGTGKTTLVAGFVNAGEKMFGDDFCIVGNGNIYSYPQAFSVYPHHLPILGYSDRSGERAFRRTAMIDKLLNATASGSSRPAKVARVILSSLRTPSINVMPEHIFGPEALADMGSLHEILALERSGEVNELERESIDANSLADQASVVLWHEWHASFHDLLLYDALGESGLGTIGRFHQVRDVALKVFQSIPCFRVRIPDSWDNATLIQEFLTFWGKTPL